MNKITTNFNYAAYRVGDMVVFCSSSFPGMVIRCFSSGFKDWNNYNVPTHIAQIVQVEGQFLIAEMMASGLVVRSLEYYNRKNEPSWVKSIKRNPVYDDPAKRAALNARIFKDLRYTLDFDFKGLLEFVFKKIEDDKSKKYCSEYLFEQTKLDGVEYPVSFDTMVSPVNLDVLTSWVVVPDWKL